MSGATSATLINGEPGHLIEVADRGVQYGDGLFETVRCEHGAPRWFDRHLARLRKGCERLGLPAPDAGLLESEVHQLAAGDERRIIKILYTRGVGAARGYAPGRADSATRIISAHPWPLVPAHWPANFQVARARLQLGENPRLAGIKHLNRLEQVLAAAEAAQRSLDEVLLGTAAGDYISGAMSNLFLIEADTLITPPLERCGIEGIMRALVLEHAVRVGWRPLIEPVSASRLAASQGIFLTNVRLGLQCVHSLDGRALRPDPRVAMLRELLDVHS